MTVHGSGDGSRLPKVLCLDSEHQVLAALTRALQGRFEVVGSSDLGGALAQIEGGGDFMVAVVALDALLADSLVFLGILGEKSPTTVRIIVTERTFVDLSSLAPVTVFRLVHKASSDAMLLRTIVDAGNYHALLSKCVVQPVESLTAWEAPEEVSVVTSVSETPGPEPPWRLAVSRVGIRFDDRTIELLPGTTTLGRSRTCHVPIRDPRVSRRHASLTHDEDGITIVNTSRTSGVWVNGGLLERDQTRELRIGDRVRLGATALELCALGDYRPSLEPTRPSQREPTRTGFGEPATFAMTAALVEKCVALGRIAEAERILKPTIEGLLRHCRAGGTVLGEDVELAVNLSLRVAAQGRSGAWVDRVFELFTALACPMPIELVERLQRLIPETRGARISRFRQYVATLREREEWLSPTERYLLRRLQALESALMMSAHA